jgi:hypothetical protein
MKNFINYQYYFSVFNIFLEAEFKKVLIQYSKNPPHRAIISQIFTLIGGTDQKLW